MVSCRARSAVPGATDLFTLTGQAGEIISLALASTGGFTSSPSSRSVALTIFAPSGDVVGPALLSNSQSLYTLPVAGVYSLRVSANNLAVTGSYNISRECFCAEPKSGRRAAGVRCAHGRHDSGPGRYGLVHVHRPGRRADLAFPDQHGRVHQRPSSRSVALTLFASSGAVVGSTVLSNGQVPYTLPASGMFAARVSANNLAMTGSYTVRRTCP